jgi:putative oxidoreductase
MMTGSLSRSATAIVWTLQLLVAAMFFMAGGSKLAGVPMMVQMFNVIGLGQWFRYLTGVIEVTSAAGLLLPATAPYAAILLAATMIGAIVTHLAIIGGSPAIPIVLLAASSAIVWIRRQQLQGALAA